MRRRGFSLVEVLVALVVMEVGLLGVLGTLVLASRILNEAQVLERGVSAMEDVYRRVDLGLLPPSGRDSLPGGEVLWDDADGGLVRVTFQPEAFGVPVTLVGARIP